MDPHRARVRSMLAARCPDLTTEQVASVEVGIYNHAIEYSRRQQIVKNWGCNAFVQAYASRARSVVNNLDRSSYVGNTRLLSRLQDGEFPPQQLANMRPPHAFPERWKDLVDEKQRKDEHVVDKPAAAMTDAYRCSRCGKREITYTAVQLRSADEATSLLMSCLTCGNRWRIG